MAKIDKLINQASEHLEPEEIIHSVVMGVYETKWLGTDSTRLGIFLATDRRVIFYGNKMFGYEMEVFPYSTISSIEMSKGFLGLRTGILCLFRGEMRVRFARIPLAGITRANFLLFSLTICN